MNFLEFWNEWGGVLAMVVAVPWLAFGWYSTTKTTHSPADRAFWLKCCVGITVGTWAYAGLLVGLEYKETPPEFSRSGNPALKLEVRQASWKKEVDGWKAMGIMDNRSEIDTFNVSPDVELSNADVVSTRVRFSPSSKPVSRWKGGVTFLFFSVVLFVACCHHKEFRRMWGIFGVVCLLVGAGTLWLGLTSTAERFEPRGIWQVVIRFDEAGTKKLADVTAPLVDTTKYPPNRVPYPSYHVAFLIDGKLNFVAPIWKQHTDGVYYLTQMGSLTEADATRIAKGIVGP